MNHRTNPLLLGFWVTLACTSETGDGSRGEGGSAGSAAAGTNASGHGGETAGASGTATAGSGGAADGGTGGTAGTTLGGATSGGASSTGGAGGNGGTMAGGSSNGGSSAGGTPAAVGCGPLGIDATGATVVSPAQAADLDQIVYDAPTGSTILLEDGTYAIDAILQVRSAGITLSSVGGDRSLVTIDAAYAVPEAIAVSASNVTIASLTITHAVDHLVHVYTGATGADVTGTVLHDLALVDGGEQFVKVNPGGSGGFIDDGRVSCSSFLLTDAGRPNVEACCGGCYTGGIDVHAGWRWHVEQNRFEGIYCDGAGLAEHAVHFWKGARDTVVERNVIVDCARGVGLGLDGGQGTRIYPDDVGSGTPLAHYGGIVRNNVIWAEIPWFDTGIEIHWATGVVVANNTVLSSDAATGFFSSIDVRFDGNDATVVNNLTRRITSRDLAVPTLLTNVEDTPLSWFSDATNADFHLTASATGAIDQGTARPDLGLDLAGVTHDQGASPEIGAHEYTP